MEGLLEKILNKKAETLEQMEYPGRGIVIGKTDKNETFCTYFITGRSPSSQARKLTRYIDIILTEPTDQKELAKGNPDLLIYNAIAWFGDTVAISNGKHTDSIITATLCTNHTLKGCTEQWNYEPDSNNTPRISGRIIKPYSEHATAELGIIKKGRKTIRENHDLKLEKGKSHCITTYAGPNRNPLPPFKGQPLTLQIKATTPKQICTELSDKLKPEFRVSIATIVFAKGYHADYGCINFKEE